MEYLRARIDGYKIIKESAYEPGRRTKNIKIVYTSRGKFYLTSHYNGVRNSTIRKIREQLDDYTEYNGNVESESQVMSIMDILWLVNQTVSNANTEIETE